MAKIRSSAPSASETSPGGSDTQVQFNDAGAFGGDAGLTFNKTTNALTAGSFVGDGSLLTGLPGATTNYAALHKTADGTTTHYGTLTAAKTAAATGDSIEVFAGTYNEINLAKDGVYWWFHPGAVINATTATAGAIFSDGGVVINCRIGGYGEFIRANGSNHVFHLTAYSNFSVECRKVSTAGTTGSIVYQEGGEFHMRADQIETGTSTESIYLAAAGAFQDIECMLLGAEGGGGSPFTIKCGSNSDLQTISAVRAGVVGNITNGSGVQNVELGGVYSMTNCTITNGAGRQTVSYSATLSAAFGVAAITQTGAGAQFIQADMLDITGTGINCSAGTQYIEADAIHGTYNSGSVVDISAGTQIIEAQTIRTNRAAYYAVTGSGGTQRIKGARIENIGTNGVPLDLGGQTCILEAGCSLIAEAGATKSANAASAQTLKIYGTSVGNKALDADITTQVGNFLSDSNVV